MSLQIVLAAETRLAEGLIDDDDDDDDDDNDQGTLCTHITFKNQN
jgi:hypothetical protein